MFSHPRRRLRLDETSAVGKHGLPEALYGKGDGPRRDRSASAEMAPLGTAITRHTNYRTRETPLMQPPASGLTGLPQAKDWVGQFATLMPVVRAPTTRRGELTAGIRRVVKRMTGRRRDDIRPIRRAPDWIAALAARILDAHRRRVLTDPAATSAVDREIAVIVRDIDTAFAEAVEFASKAVGVGELVCTLASRWVTYAQCPDADISTVDLSSALHAYSTHIEQLQLTWDGDGPVERRRRLIAYLSPDSHKETTNSMIRTILIQLVYSIAGALAYDAITRLARHARLASIRIVSAYGLDHYIGASTPTD
ncbi:hypothetical protein [Nocardia sp. NPDC050710]|uniref:hypothetical protein n=1 Tax=Nocardia sp. NPDC050710 TaxID=3157220 RepID=UPI0033CDFEB2